MFNKVNAETQNVKSMIEGLHRFLTATTGTTVDPRTDRFVMNLDGVLNNNLHFLQDTQQEGQPNADATTEGQSVLVIGYLYCYLGTGEVKYLEKAEWYWQAYVEWWYKQQPIPDEPKRWICNWIINGKEPILANYPVNPIDPTHGGFKGTEFVWTNGLVKIPHGAPHWGEYSDVATFAFDGVLSYDSIVADVKALKPDGATDWDNDGVKYPVDWIILWNGKKVNWDGDILSEGHSEAEKGTVQLQDRTVQGVHKFNYATRNPVEHGGYMIDRNEPHHNRPIHTPLGKNVNNMGNAADGEVWFVDACYLLWKTTGKAIYKQALDSVHFTANEYTYIDATNKFFRRDSTANTPFTEGISYYYTYPDAEVFFERDTRGYIEVIPSVPSSVSLEQNAVVYRVNSNSKVRSTYGGVDYVGNPVRASVGISISSIRTGKGESYAAPVPTKTNTAVEAVDIPLKDFVRTLDPNGDSYLMASESATTWYGRAENTERYTTGISGPTLPISGSRTGTTLRTFYPEGSGGLIIGFWLTETGFVDVKSIIYRSDNLMNIEVGDDDNWYWHWELPATGGLWRKATLNKADLALNSYQSKHDDDEVRPTAPNYGLADQLEVVTGSGVNTNSYFEYYCINDMPPAFNETDGYVVLYTLTLSGGDETFTGYVGDCSVVDGREDLLKYSPGIIPFSNIYTVDSNEIGPWHGLPYPAYQAPSMYALGIGENQEIRLSNSIDFMYDSQQWYLGRYGVLGPTASAYIWDRWDAIEYGDPNTFTEFHWGDGKAWDGYQPRTFSWMCRTWQQLIDNGELVPLKLKAFCENWIKYLWEFTERADNPSQWMPSTFPKESAPIPVDDFNAGMGGLYLSGCCMAGMAGCDLPYLDELISRILVQFEENYEVLSDEPESVMNGSFSDWTGGFFFYGFHGAEAFKGLGSYLMYKNHEKGTPTDYTGTVPRGTELVPQMHKEPIRPAGEVAPAP